MEAVEFNWLAVLAAVIVAVVSGALWYSPLLFLNRWMELRGVTQESMQASGAMSPALAVGGSVVLNVIAMVVLAMVVSWSGAATLVDGLAVGAIVGFGLVISMAARAILFEQQSLPLFALNNGYTLLVFLAGGAILGGWR